MNDYFSELNAVMNYFALVDQCQNLGRNGYSLDFSMRSLPLIEQAIRKELHYRANYELFIALEKIFFPKRVTTHWKRYFFQRG